MIIVQKVSKNEDGSFSSEWKLSQDQMSYLLSYAINDLLRLGLVELEEETDETQAQLDFLEDLPTEVLGEAQ